MINMEHYVKHYELHIIIWKYGWLCKNLIYDLFR